MVKIARRLRLGDLLVRHRWIRSEQLHQALTNQLTIGGRLGTNLVETDALSLDQVGEALGVQHGVPVATPELLDQVERSTLRQIQPAFCAARGLLPLVISDRTLHLAMLDPPRVEEIRQLTAAKGIAVQPYAIPQLRLLYYLERHYGIQRARRYLRVDTGTARKDDRRRYLSPTIAPPDSSADHCGQTTRHLSQRADRASAAPPQPHLTGPLPRVQAAVEPDDGLVYLDQIRRPSRHHDSSFEIEIDASFEDDERVSVASIQSMDEALDALRTANSRDAVLQALVRPVVSCTTLNVVFSPRGELGVAAVAWGTQVTPPKVKALVVPLNTESLLQQALDSATVAHGTVEQDSLQQMIAVYLKVDLPAEICVAAVSAAGRVVNLLCCQTTGRFPSDTVEVLERLADAATAAYDRLLAELTGG